MRGSWTLCRGGLAGVLFELGKGLFTLGEAGCLADVAFLATRTTP